MTTTAITVQSPISTLSPVSQAVAEGSTGAYQIIKSGFATIASKIQDLWSSCLPYLQKVGEFFKTKLGIASLLLVGSFTLIALSHKISHKALSVLCLTAGVLAAVASGGLIVASGLLTGVFV
jgi:hypothetical protein